ncbi:ISNCY-like element ISChcr1 family transposase [Chondromyces crocatus]|nr:ISNCY-like element ISChcr1 family transposase [Chondromyces crocatus]
MRKSFDRQRPLTHLWLDHPQAKHLEHMAQLLDALPEATELAFGDLVAAGVDPHLGRQGMSAEQVLRVLILKQMQDFSYEELEFHLADSATYRAFCGLGIADTAPSKSTLQRNIKVISEQTLEAIHRMVVACAKREGVDNGKRVRVDSTVINAAIHPPTDSSLLKDSVRVLTRLLSRARRWTKKKSTDHRRRAKRRALGITHARSAEQRLPLYRDLIAVTKKTLRAARVASSILPRVQAGKEQAEVDRLVEQLRYHVLAAERVLDQAERRVLRGQSVPAQQKVVSIFEPHVDVIVKDHRETLYGHKVFFSAGASGLVVDVVVPRGNPADSAMATTMMTRHVEICGEPPKQAAFDGGFASQSNLDALKGLGIRDVAFSKRRGLDVMEMVKSPRIYRALRNFRAGIEGIISYLKRAFGLARCDWRTLASFRAYVMASVIAANLLTIALGVAR